jgi:short-subunit dehydrogenase
MSLNPPLQDFKNKNVWLIGASSGIGHACARWLANEGANLVISSRREESLIDLNELLIREFTIQSKIIPLDVMSDQSVEAAQAQVLEHFPTIDLLLFVSGVYTPVQAETLNMQDSQTMISTNLLGPIRVLNFLIPQFLKQGNGHIALVGSVAGYSGLPKSLIYGPTKAALLNFAESLYEDLSPKGIGVHIICPGFVQTPATAINDFKMPSLITPERAAEEIGKGLKNGEFETHFPKEFSFFLKFLRILPYPIYFWLVKKFIVQ